MSEAVLRLQRAQAGGSANPLLRHLMDQALLRLEATRVVLVGHRWGGSSAAYSPDGKRIVTVGWDQTARVWDTDSGRPLSVPQGHQSGVNTATSSPNGKLVATASADNTARVWDADSGRRLIVLQGHKESVQTA